MPFLMTDYLDLHVGEEAAGSPMHVVFMVKCELQLHVFVVSEVLGVTSLVLQPFSQAFELHCRACERLVNRSPLGLM